MVLEVILLMLVIYFGALVAGILAYKATGGCTQDCNQGRNCNCRK